MKKSILFLSLIFSLNCFAKNQDFYPFSLNSIGANYILQGSFCIKTDGELEAPVLGRGKNSFNLKGVLLKNESVDLNNAYGKVISKLSLNFDGNTFTTKPVRFTIPRSYNVTSFYESICLGTSSAVIVFNDVIDNNYIALPIYKRLRRKALPTSRHFKRRIILNEHQVKQLENIVDHFEYYYHEDRYFNMMTYFAPYCFLPVLDTDVSNNLSFRHICN